MTRPEYVMPETVVQVTANCEAGRPNVLPIRNWRAGESSLERLGRIELATRGRKPAEGIRDFEQLRREALLADKRFDDGLRVVCHLRGQMVGNYEPFRPHGFMAAEQVCYYTPPVSALPPGTHEWHVKAVDKDGNRLLPEDTLVIDMVSQSRFIENQTAIYRHYKDVDPDYANRCLEAATRCYEYFAKTWPVVTDYETSFNARPCEEMVTDLMPLAYGVRANLAMHVATDQDAFRDRAVVLADQLMALQETEFTADQKEVRGFFYANPDREAIFDSYKAHLAPRSDGMVVQGIGGDAGDRPCIRQGHWRHCEMELHHSAWFVQAVCELLASGE